MVYTNPNYDTILKILKFKDIKIIRMNKITDRILTKLVNSNDYQIVGYLKRKQSQVTYDIKTKQYTYNDNTITIDEVADILYKEAMVKRRETYKRNKQLNPNAYKVYTFNEEVLNKICNTYTIEQLISKLTDKQIEQLKYYIVRKYMQ